VFEEILGIPAHPLIIHAAVVFIPLQIVAAIVYGLIPAWRRHLVWAVLGLAVLAPASAWAAKLSGEAFEQRLIRKHIATGELIAKINQHASFAAVTAWLSLGLSAAMVILVWAIVTGRRRSPVAGNTAEIDTDAAAIMGSPAAFRLVALVFVVAAVVLAGFTGYYIFRTGDTGAHIVWTGF
jgi:hypothetical protein